MTKAIAHLDAWSATLGLPGLTDPLEPLDQAVGVLLYRLLALGDPVSPDRIAQELDLDEHAAREAVTGRPGIVLDEAGRVTASFGLTLRPMPHVIEIGGRTLYTWCAWDTMLVAAILREEAAVRSSCAHTGAPIHLMLGADGPAALEPPGVRMSMVTPTLESLATDFHAAFCSRVHFFADQAAADAWLEPNPDALILTPEEAWRFALTRNVRVYGDALAEVA